MKPGCGQISPRQCVWWSTSASQLVEVCCWYDLGACFDVSILCFGIGVILVDFVYSGGFFCCCVILMPLFKWWFYFGAFSVDVALFV